MANKSSKITKYNRGIKINAGFIIFFFVFVYILVFVISYFFKEQISIYEVTTAQIADNNTFSGVIIRDEITVNTQAAGYVTYYVSDNSMVGVNDGLFSINEGNKENQEIAVNDKVVIRDSDYLNLRRKIDTFSQNLSNTSFSSVYDFKADLNSLIFEAKSGATTTNMDDLLAQMEEKGVNITKSQFSALASNVIDNLNGVSKNDISSTSFDTEKYEYTRLTTGDLLEKNAPALRLVKGDTWRIAIQLDSKQVEKLKDLSKVTVNLIKYNIKTSAGLELIEKNGEHFAILTLNKYIANYVDDRFIDIELLLNSASGLKIPNTAITSKDFYLVPMEYITVGGHSSKEGITKIVYSENGEKDYVFVNTNIYYVDEDNNAYIDSNLIEAGTVINIPGTDEKYTISSKAPLKGVYTVNQGYFDFRRIEVIYDNDEYSIVSDATKYGLHVYDQIVSDASTADDEAVIY